MARTPHQHQGPRTRSRQPLLMQTRFSAPVLSLCTPARPVLRTPPFPLHTPPLAHRTAPADLMTLPLSLTLLLPRWAAAPLETASWFAKCPLGSPLKLQHTVPGALVCRLRQSLDLGCSRMQGAGDTEDELCVSSPGAEAPQAAELSRDVGDSEGPRHPAHRGGGREVR